MASALLSSLEAVRKIYLLHCSKMVSFNLLFCSKYRWRFFPTLRSEKIPIHCDYIRMWYFMQLKQLSSLHREVAVFLFLTFFFNMYDETGCATDTVLLQE